MTAPTLAERSSEPALDLSVVIPIYDEEGSIPTLVEKLHQVLSGLDLRYEIVFVDDGSSDGSFDRMREGCATTT